MNCGGGESKRKENGTKRGRKKRTGPAAKGRKWTHAYSLGAT